MGQTDTFTHESFLEHLNTTFRVVQTGGPPIELELVSVTDHDSSPKQVQFSICFRGPLETLLRQRTYSLLHDRLGEMELFLVPIARGSDGFRYEAVFNRFVEPAQA